MIMKTIYYLKKKFLLLLLLSVGYHAPIKSMITQDIQRGNEVELAEHMGSNNREVNNPAIDLEVSNNNEEVDFVRTRFAGTYRWLHKVCEALCFWRVYEYKGIYFHPGYEAGTCDGSVHCLRDMADFIKSGCKRVRGIPNVDKYRVRRNGRLYGHPICTRSGALSFTIFFYAFLNVFVKDDDSKLTKLINEDFQICQNDLLDRTVQEIPNYQGSNLGSLGNVNNASQALDGLYGLYSYVIDNIVVDFSEFSTVPSATVIAQLEQNVTSDSKIVNDTHQLGYVYYPDFWPDEADARKVRIFYEENNVTTAENTTTAIDSSSTSDLSITSPSITKRLCFYSRKSGPLTVEFGVGNFGSTCANFELPGGTITVNTTTTIENITIDNEILNDFYNTTITKDLELIGISNFVPTSNLNVSTEEFTELAKTVAEKAKERFKSDVLEFIRRVKWAASTYAFIAGTAPWLTTGYVVNRMGIKLRILTTMDGLSRVPFIILVVGSIYLFEYLPFDFKDIFVVITTPKLFFDFVLDLGTGICHLQSEKEVAFIYALGGIVAQQQKVVSKVNNIVNFVNNDIAVEGTYRNISGLVFQDLYQNFTEQKNIYEQMLSGSILPEGFPVLSGKVLCDFNRSGIIFNITSNTNCATFADTTYSTDIFNQLRESYELSLKGINWGLILYPVMPAAVTIFIESVFAIVFPMARYRGRFIATSAMKNIESQKKVIRFIRYTSIIPFAFSVPVVIVGIAEGIIL